MKKPFLLFALAWLFCHAAFATTHIKDDLSLKVNLRYEQVNPHGFINEYLIGHLLKTSANNSQWIMIPNHGQSGKLVLLSKIKKLSSKEISVKFLVLDASNTKPVIISAPQLITRYGQKSQLIIDERNQKMELSVIAKELA